jgi:hypothetical protein
MSGLSRPGEMSLSEYTIKLIFEDRIEEAEEMLLCESLENDLLSKINETGALDYLMKIEQFFDQRDLYLYNGWEDAEILSAPKIDKFWISLDLRVPKDCELKGAVRTCSDKEAQNSVKFKQLEDGSYFIRFKILRRILDKIEMDSKDRAEDQAAKESEV